MLYTYRATTDALAAVTHVNGTARLQTVTPASNPPMYDLLTAFRELTGFGVLCNTSLNFKGKGFINNLTDLDAYARQHELDGFVVEENLRPKDPSPTGGISGHMAQPGN
jgi:hydroxymethyl cephem carbamoyltransferase